MCRTDHPRRNGVSRRERGIHPFGVDIWPIEFLDQGSREADRLLRTADDQAVGAFIRFDSYRRRKINHAPAPTNPFHENPRVASLLIVEKFLHDGRDLGCLGVRQLESPSIHGVGRRA